MTSSLFEGYQHEGFFDEFVDELGEVRPHYRQLALRLGALAPEELARRERLRDAAFRIRGHHVHRLRTRATGIERTFPMDLLPRIIPADEWAHIEAGLGPAGHGPQHVPRRPLRRGAGRGDGRHHPEVGS